MKGLWVSFCWPKQNFDFYKCSFMALFSLHASLILTPSGLAKQQLSSLCYCVYAYVHVYVSVCAPRKNKLFEDNPLFRQYIATSPTKAVIHCHTERSTESIVLLIGQASPIQRVGNENERLCCFTENGPVHPRKKMLGKISIVAFNEQGYGINYHHTIHLHTKGGNSRELQCLRNSGIIKVFVSKIQRQPMKHLWVHRKGHTYYVLWLY